MSKISGVWKYNIVYFVHSTFVPSIIRSCIPCDENVPLINTHTKFVAFIWFNCLLFVFLSLHFFPFFSQCGTTSSTYMQLFALVNSQCLSGVGVDRRRQSIQREFVLLLGHDPSPASNCFWWTARPLHFKQCSTATDFSFVLAIFMYPVTKLEWTCYDASCEKYSCWY